MNALVYHHPFIDGGSAYTIFFGKYSVTDTLLYILVNGLLFLYPFLVDL